MRGEPLVALGGQTRPLVGRRRGGLFVGAVRFEQRDHITPPVQARADQRREAAVLGVDVGALVEQRLDAVDVAGEADVVQRVRGAAVLVDLQACALSRAKREKILRFWPLILRKIIDFLVRLD